MRDNMITLREILKNAQEGRYAVGSFSPRYTSLIDPILNAAQRNNSPAIIQISQKELTLYGITPAEFADEFYRCVSDKKITVPVVLHLDHTRDFKVVKDAIAAGFSSVMIDASEKKLSENIEITAGVVDYARGFGVSVEGELGKIGNADFIETENDEEMYTIPEEAKEFVEKTGVDALAVSVGTAHGVYAVRKPKIDYERLKAIGRLVKVHLVLHGGSGVPAEMIGRAIKLPLGAITKVNIATDLEQAFLKALGRKERMTNKECQSVSKELFAVGSKAVEDETDNKIGNYLFSRDRCIV